MSENLGYARVVNIRADEEDFRASKRPRTNS